MPVIKSGNAILLHFRQLSFSKNTQNLICIPNQKSLNKSLIKIVPFAKSIWMNETDHLRIHFIELVYVWRAENEESEKLL